MNLHPWSQELSLQTHYLLIGNRVEAMEWPAQRAWLMVSRSACHFLSLDLSEVPPAARSKFIDLKVKNNSPWVSPSYYLANSGADREAIWIWDSAWEAETAQGIPAALRKQGAVPETVLLPRGADGLVVQECTQGFDYQFWKDGCLLSSRWSHGELSAEEISLFRSDCGAGQQGEAAVSEREWLSRPWTERVMDWRQRLRDESTVMTSVAALVVFALFLEFGLVLAGLANVQLSTANAEDLQEQLGEKLRHRLMAERLHDVNQQWSTLLPAYTQLELVAEFERLLDGQDFRLISWEYNDGGLQITLQNPEIDSREIVTRLESGVLFNNARVSPGRREGELDIQLSVAGAKS